MAVILLVASLQITMILVPVIIIPAIRSNWTEEFSKTSAFMTNPPVDIVLIAIRSESKKFSSDISKVRVSNKVDTR